MRFDLLDIIAIVGSVQGFFLMFIVYKQKANNKSVNTHLIWLLMILTIMFVVRLLYIKGEDLWPRKYYLLPDVIIFLFGPLVYLYFKTLLEKGTKHRNGWILFVPSGLFMLSVLYILQLDKAAFESALGSWLSDYYLVVSYSAILWNGLLIFYSFQTIFRSDPKANSGRSRHIFFFAFLSILLLCLCTWATTYTCSIFDINIPYLTYDIIWISISLLIFLLAYYIILAPDLLKPLDSFAESQKMSVAVMEEKKGTLIHLLETERIYLNPNLTLADVAEKMNISANKLSWLINLTFRQNFNDLINEYRVKAFILKLHEKKHERRTLLALAYEVGFNSKTTFNTAFKKATNFTPSMYIRQKMK